MTSTNGTQPGVIRVPLRWRDLDHQAHVYHATMLTLLDEARTHWLRDVIGVDFPDEYVVVRIEIDYVAELLIDAGAVDVEFKVSRVGQRSLTTAEVVRTPQGVEVARTAVTMVMWDRDERRSRLLTDAERAAAATMMAPGVTHA
ncbi:acyl-CoA thioesterase [Aeromicrobium sp. UC242_57]|uniref:acyl-CoA thioesterase n=1 Tax=Aeromicrobium sp. UC242_57 TaxID=3374624 RepID=UPI00379EF13B